MTRREKRPADLVASAAQDVVRATHRLRPDGPDVEHEQLRDTGWQLTQLTGGLVDLSAELALALAEDHRQRLLRDELGGDPSEQVARASRALTELRQAVDAAHDAAREYFAAVSHLVVEVDPSARPARRRSRR